VALVAASTTNFWPTHEPKSFVLVNTIFQFFFLAYLPLCFTKVEEEEKTGNQNSFEETIQMYDNYTWTTTLVYWISLAICTPTLMDAVKKGSFSNDGVHLLFCDICGVLSGCLAIIALDRWHDDVTIFQTSDVSVKVMQILQHLLLKCNFIWQLLSFVEAVILGPGNVLAKYFYS